MKRRERREIERNVKKDYALHLKNKPSFNITIDSEEKDNKSFYEAKNWNVRKKSLEGLMKKYGSHKSSKEEDL